MTAQNPAHPGIPTAQDLAYAMEKLDDLVKIRANLPIWTRREISRARTAGMTWPQIAHRLGVSIRTVQDWAS